MADQAEIRNMRVNIWGRFVLYVAVIILAAYLLNLFRIRIDLTEDKRYTLSAPTKAILEKIKSNIYIQVYLDGEMPIPLKRLRRSVREMLEEFRIASGRNIDYEFINPADTKNEQQRDAQYRTLYNKGLIPYDLRARNEEGTATQKYIFPGMIINYNGIEVPVNFLKNNQMVSYEENILHSVEGLEYEMIQTIATVASDTIHKIAFLEGQDEWPEIEVADITFNLAKYFTVDRGIIGGKPGVLDGYAAIIVARPSKDFSEADKLVIDQYIMNGGKVLWLLEEVAVNTDSLANGETIGLYRPLNIEDQLFRYGARINPEIVQDIECARIRITVMTGSEQKQIVPVPWLYYPLLIPNQKHPVTRNLNRVKGEFVNTIDTVGLDPSISKTVLLSTSAFSRTLSPPLVITLKEVEETPERSKFTRSGMITAVLLEGQFTSAFRNRMISNLISEPGFRVRSTGMKTRMIVIADGNIIRNEVSRSGMNELPLQLGQDKYTGEMFGNRDFLVNCVNYLVDDNGLMELRSREMKLRLLDRIKVKDHKAAILIFNTLCPVIIVIIAGLVYGLVRRRRYTRIPHE